MSIILSKLEKPRQHGSKFTARCPACAQIGADKAGNHFYFNETTRRWGCIANRGEAGKAHRRLIFELIGEQSSKPVLARYVAPPATINPKEPLCLPGLRKLRVTEMAQIASFRRWPLIVGMELLARRGLLWGGMVRDAGLNFPSWTITDSSRRNAQSRKLDGGLWEGKGWHTFKSKTAFGAESSWPIGAADIGDRPLVMLCEGGPDFLASFFVAWSEGWAIPGFDIEKIAPVCICGAGHTIPADALPYFAGKHVRISIHSDPEGQAAGERWAAQLYGAGARCVDRFEFDGLTRPDGEPVGDLSDFAELLDPENLAGPEYLPEVRALAELPDWIFSTVSASAVTV